MNVNTAADITRMLGTMASNKAFVLDENTGKIAKAGLGHRLAKHFGAASALQKNTQTINAIRVVLRDNPAYSGISEQNFNECFSAFNGGHAVTGARLLATIQALNEASGQNVVPANPGENAADPRGTSLSLVRYAPKEIEEAALFAKNGLTKEDIARAYHFERAFGLGTDEAIRNDIDNGIDQSVFLKMAANPQYLTDKAAYLKGKAALAKHEEAMQQLSNNDRLARVAAKDRLTNIELKRLSGKLERGEFGDREKFNRMLQKTIADHFGNVAPNSKADKMLRRQLESLHLQQAQKTLTVVVTVRFNYRIGKLPDRLTPFEFEPTRYPAELNGQTLDAIAARLKGLSDAEAETFLSLSLTGLVQNGLRSAKADKVNERLDDLLKQAKALVAFSESSPVRLFGSAEEERAAWTSLCQRAIIGKFGGEKGLFVKGLDAATVIDKVASVANRMRNILRTIAAGGGVPTLEQLHELLDAGVAHDNDPNVREDTLAINTFACELALRSLPREGGVLAKLQKGMTEPNLKKLMRNAFGKLKDTVPETDQLNILRSQFDGMSLGTLQEYRESFVRMDELLSMLPTLFEAVQHCDDTALTMRDETVDNLGQQLQSTFGDTFIPSLSGEDLDPKALNGRARSEISDMHVTTSRYVKEVAFVINWISSVAGQQGPLTNGELIQIMTRNTNLPQQDGLLTNPPSLFLGPSCTCALAELEEPVKAAFLNRFTSDTIHNIADRIFAELDNTVSPELQQKVVTGQVEGIQPQELARINKMLDKAKYALLILGDMAKAFCGPNVTVESTDKRTVWSLMPAEDRDE